MVTDAGASSAPAGTATAARCPIRSPSWSPGITATDGSAATAAVVRSWSVISCPAASGAAATTTGAVPDTIPNRAAAPATDTTMMPTAAATSFAFTAGRTDLGARGATAGAVAPAVRDWVASVGVVVIRTSGRCPRRRRGWW